MLEQYKTVYEGGQGEIVEKKSRFLADLGQVETEEEALKFLEGIRKKYWDARHHCFAYVIGEKRELMRCSDDGEPQGTAGKPMLEILLKEELYNTIVVVTRYFGGTLLGTGGLVRAYSKAVQEGIRSSRIITKYQGILTEIKTDYQGVGKIQYILSKDNVPILASTYEEDVKFQALLSVQKAEAVKKSVIEATNARAVITDQKELYYAISEGEYLLFE